MCKHFVCKQSCPSGGSPTPHEAQTLACRTILKASRTCWKRINVVFLFLGAKYLQGKAVPHLWTQPLASAWSPKTSQMAKN